MKILALALLSCAAVWGQDLGAVVHDPTGTVADTPLTSSYQLADTPVGNSSSIDLRFTDLNPNPVQILAVTLNSQPGASGSASPNFTVTGLDIGKTLASGSSGSFEDVTVNFIPQSTGSISGYLQVSYQIQQNGCVFGSTTPSTQCASQSANLSTLTGNGTAAQFSLTYLSAGGQVALQPDGSSPLNFGNVETSTTESFTFTLTNVSGSPLTSPAVALQSQIFGSSAFSLDTSAMPASLAAGASGSFTITFAPGQTGQATGTFTVGASVYPISGTGVADNGVDALELQYVDSTGVRGVPQAATPISFGQVVAGSNSPATLSFTITNPATAFNAVSLSPLTVTGTGFSLTGAPAIPASIAPGASISFQIVFSPAATGTYNGMLTFGDRTFALTGSSITSAVPTATLQVTPQPLTSQQQATLTIQLASASTVSAIGTLTLSFSSDVTGITDDPAILFLATSGRQLQVNVTAGSESVTYNGQSAITFQSGTTAGTLTFTLTFPNAAPITQSFTISAAQISISSGTAVWESPNLVVTLTGFDNTYSAGPMSFTFLDTSGNIINPTPITVDASSDFHQYFFTRSTAGGAFSVQTTFPVTGTATRVGSVQVKLSNSAGTSTISETFQ